MTQWRMKASKLRLLVCLACASATAQPVAYEQVHTDARNGTSVVILATDKPRVTEKSFTWRYQIRNDSTQEIWICDYLGPTAYEAYMAQDGNTLFIHRRLDLPQIRFIMGLQPHGKYVRLRPGPTLFTFDNHDPGGGFVCLNDGTVKFIRTQAELRQLRWQ